MSIQRTDGWYYEQTVGHTNRQTDRPTDIWTDTDRVTYTRLCNCDRHCESVPLRLSRSIPIRNVMLRYSTPPTDELTEEHTYGQTDKRADKQTDMQNDTQTEIRKRTDWHADLLVDVILTDLSSEPAAKYLPSGETSNRHGRALLEWDWNFLTQLKEQQSRKYIK